MKRAYLQQALGLMERAAGRVFPCGVLLVAESKGILVHEGFGRVEGRPCVRDTVFDLASLTKPLCTAALTMVALQRGVVDLDAPVGDFLEWLGGTDKADLTIRQLLGHRSGLPSWRPYGESLLRNHGTAIAGTRKAIQCVRDALRGEELEGPPGMRAIYSDLGYMLLGFALEAAFDTPLDQVFETALANPLGLRSIRFRRVGSPMPSSWRQVAPTEEVPWRGGVVCGQVHDDNAFVLDGVAGHAGLFSTAGDVYALLREMWRAYAGAGDSLFDGRVVRLFWDLGLAEGDGTWLLGFDTPSKEGSSAGTSPPAGLVGHLGFTGTSFWLHKPTGAVVVLLTNRVHPTRKNEEIRLFRPRLHQACFAALGL